MHDFFGDKAQKHHQVHMIGSGQSFLYTNLRHQHIFKRMFTKLSIIILSRIPKFYLRILATSVSSERAFLAAGKIVCAQRASLRGDNVEMLIFLKSNLRDFSNLCKKKKFLEFDRSYVKANLKIILMNDLLIKLCSFHCIYPFYMTQIVFTELSV